jgi:hypothetical protein
MGLQGMIDDLVQKSDFATGENISVEDLEKLVLKILNQLLKSFLLKIFQMKS